MTAPVVHSRQDALIAPAVLALVILPHGLITRDLFDGASVAFAWMTGDDSALRYWLMLANWPLTVLFHKVCFFIAQLIDVHYLVLVKAVIAALLLGLYREFRLLGRQLFGLTAPQDRWLALLCSASPALYTLVSSQIVPILLCIWLVFIGHRLWRSDGTARRLAGLAVLALSFQLNSNLVFALALEALFLARFARYRAHRLKWTAALGFTAVAVYAGMRLASPPQQIFAEYNRLLLPWRTGELRRIVRAILMFLTWGVIPLAAVLATCATLLAATSMRPSAAGLRAALRGNGFGLLAGAFLACAAMFPYVMVGKGAPLFTLVGLGSSLTEQVLAAVHTGIFAPTWANTSGRHGFLYAPGVAIFTWFLCRLVVQWWRATSDHVPDEQAVPKWLLPVLLPVFLVWVLPAYYNKLDNQAAEISLVGGLRTLPAAPPGVVDLHYGPGKDWIVPTGSASVMLAQAWGRWDYWAMFHSLAAYHADLQWQYHAYLRDTGGLRSPLIQGFFAMRSFPGEACLSRYQATLPAMRAAHVMVAGVWPQGVPAARIQALGSDCVSGRVLPNPTPDKVVIP